ncbi:hypothetical protein [Bacillus sp. KH172YL63]|uniref:hypothetical protein n=1 Tax=Bacillus sp. KH172YL63 TaxID=2709784 RepID=UPI0013E45F69|nr:hypothetical protein [Bacillus sp. KH172YL63]BCB02471.1 hypothetical protein KH172YL63_06040 [Bacillus sp. KH172YL63]
MRCKQGCGIVLAFMCILALFSCSNEDDREWFETKEEAIEYGTSKVEGDLKSTLLSTEEYEGETIVFYDYGGALGVASISRGEEGYSWYRSNAYLDFESDGETSYTTAGFDLETESGLKIPILCGEAVDPSIEKMLLTGDGPQRELDILGDARHFYAIHDSAFTQLEVTAVKPGE